MVPMAERHYVIYANVSAADSALRLGAKVLVMSAPGDPDNIQVRGLSRGGRNITKWTKRSRLKNFRVGWRQHAGDCACIFETAAIATSFLSWLAPPSRGTDR